MNMDETAKNSDGMRERKKGEIADDADFGDHRDTPIGISEIN